MLNKLKQLGQQLDPNFDPHEEKRKVGLRLINQVDALVILRNNRFHDFRFDEMFIEGDSISGEAKVLIDEHGTSLGAWHSVYTSNEVAIRLWNDGVAGNGGWFRQIDVCLTVYIIEGSMAFIWDGGVVEANQHDRVFVPPNVKLLGQWAGEVRTLAIYRKIEEGKSYGDRPKLL